MKTYQFIMNNGTILVGQGFGKLGAMRQALQFESFTARDVVEVLQLF